MREIRKLLAGACALPLLVAPALAQEAGEAAPAYAEAEDGALAVEAYGLTVGELEDMAIYGEDEEQIGEVEDVLVDETGTPVALAVETEGFIGLGEDDVIVDLGQLTVAGDRLVTGLTEDELEELAEWDD